MADLFVFRTFHCLWLPSIPNFPPKPSAVRLRFSAPISRWSRFSSITHNHMLAKSTSSSTSVREEEDEDVHIISSTQHSDGSFLFRFGNASEIRELEQQRLVPECVEEVEEAGVRVLPSDGVQNLSSEVDHNSGEEIEPSSTVLVGVADQNPQLLVKEKESGVADSDPEEPVINDSQSNDRLLKLDSVVDDDGQHGILSGDVTLQRYVVPSESKEDSQADTHKEVVVSTLSPASEVFSDLNIGASGSGGVKEKEVDKGHGVDRAANSLTGGVDAQLSELVPVSTSLESQPSVDTATTNNLIGSVDAEVTELVPVLTSSESELVDYSATNCLQGGAVVDISGLVLVPTSLESDHSVDGATNNPPGSAEVDINELVQVSDLLESEEVDNSATDDLIESANVDIGELVTATTSLESEEVDNSAIDNLTGSADADISELVAVSNSLEAEHSVSEDTNNLIGSADIDISELVPASTTSGSEEVNNSEADNQTGSANADISELVAVSISLESEHSVSGDTNNFIGSADVDISELVPASTSGSEVDNSAADDQTGSADADKTELALISKSLESEPSIDGATSNLTGSADVDISKLVPASTSLESEEVDNSVTDELIGSVDADISELVPVSKSLESEPSIDGETSNLTGSADVDISKLVSASTSLESEEVDNSVTDDAIGIVDADISELEPVSTTLKPEQVNYSSTDNLTSGIDADLSELAPESASFESELLVTNEETTHVALGDSAGASKMENSAMLHNLVSSSDLENKTDVSSIEGSDFENPSRIALPGIHSVEMASHGEETSRTELFLVSGVACLPHPSKALTGREDAYFISPQNWLAVADGVGQWSFEGSNTGLYIRELMEKCENIVTNDEHTSTIKPAEVLIRSATETQTPGSSSLLVAYFDGQAVHAANVGNTGFIIIRDGAIFKKSNAMFHEFSFPLHIVKGDDHSEIVEEYKIELNDGDVIIFATNGLFDNLYEKEIASIISKSLQASLRPQEMAELLALRAQEVGRSTSTRSPFGDAAQAVGYVGYAGGKLDDVTVIVSLVQNR